MQILAIVVVVVDTLCTTACFQGKLSVAGQILW